MKTRTLNSDEVELMYYFHYLSDVKYSIADIMAMFSLSKKTICIYLSEIRNKVDKDNTYKTEIINKFKNYETISKFKKDLTKDVEEFSYVANVKDINKRLIELDKKIEGLLSSQPISLNNELILQSIASKVDKIPDFVRVVIAALKDILKDQEKNKEFYNILVGKLDELKKDQENYNNSLNILTEINNKLDKILNYAENYEDIEGNSPHFHHNL